ncbi:Hypothetical_protein [Hexamita inflata]|uniref:Hypothetical_protein n=1 Tax=Hexamita inflata TaxID=28002 RepID=A0AA86NUF2_9EUKA|nr:Hypothetical protein HINF_LOCUS13609 [Hexamita inflata]CAI9926004.1 Hypothetical protein HINF_LOCUS13649 [Hexamita inflata]CAI9933925.1 Hypothetical protein HINF_LOCUS21570 [Hexamita inflata]
MGNCCKAFCVKITYTILFGAMFTVGLLLSFDVLIKQYNFHGRAFDTDTSKTQMGAVIEAQIRSPIFSMPLDFGYYNPNTKCFSNDMHAAEQFYYYSDDRTTTVRVHGEDMDVECVSVNYVDNDDGNIIIYQTSLWCSFGGLILAVVLLLCIWCCCSSWCRCCCCKEVQYSKIQMVYV